MVIGCTELEIEKKVSATPVVQTFHYLPNLGFNLMEPHLISGLSEGTNQGGNGCQPWVISELVL